MLPYTHLSESHCLQFYESYSNSSSLSNKNSLHNYVYLLKYRHIKTVAYALAVQQVF